MFISLFLFCFVEYSKFSYLMLIIHNLLASTLYCACKPERFLMVVHGENDHKTFPLQFTYVYFRLDTQ